MSTTEPRKEYASLKHAESLDRRYRGPARIGAYRRWLQRSLVEASDRGDKQEVERLTDEMTRLGLTNG